MRTPHPTPARRNRTTRALTGIALGAALALAAPLAASAHVEVSPDTAPPGQTSTLTFGFHHGCDGAPTTALHITIPDGVGNATPVVQGGWTIHRTLRPDGTPAQVTYTADTPIEQGLAASVQMDVLFDTAARGKTIAFPVTQTCTTGSTVWDQTPKTGQDPETLDNPAPAVSVRPAAATRPQAAARPQADTTAQWLGGAGLAAGLTALAVSLTRRRTRR